MQASWESPFTSRAQILALATEVCTRTADA